MDELFQMKAAQKLAYEAVVSVRSQLKVGMSEIEATELIEDFFAKRDHTLFFHKPFAWFGDRTAFVGFKRPGLDSLGLDFLPTKRKLEEGMPVILDVAPAVDGLAVDIGYSFCFGENQEVELARKDLLLFRELILKAANEKQPITEIYRQVDQLLKDKGYKNCHAIYPLGVLGHKIGKLPLLKLPKIPIMGFHPQAYAYLLKEKIMGPAIMTEDETRPLSVGLWAIEPHLGKENFGVKFEEILVVTPTHSYWLDDSLPHVTEIKSA
ncbi:MAG: aminopeptidase P family protein [Bacteriovoracaceae bacterium]|nr:aminopeptidase P family protein [Bacteriovoracaceae bacterium]